MRHFHHLSVGLKFCYWFKGNSWRRCLESWFQFFFYRLQNDSDSHKNLNHNPFHLQMWVKSTCWNVSDDKHNILCLADDNRYLKNFDVSMMHEIEIIILEKYDSSHFPLIISRNRQTTYCLLTSYTWDCSQYNTVGLGIWLRF